ncbi:hypothetical protein TNCV_2942341 [Trichonephila clavipes]|nr:hypothetical protein TNCV_2942341 [Trichonephila clavipes]
MDTYLVTNWASSGLVITAATQRGIDSTSFWKRSTGQTCQMLAKVVYNSVNDEAHFWVNGYVNKQNCRIWSEANPQVYVETPLHPEKLTVWCDLWAGGILLQKR